MSQFATEFIKERRKHRFTQSGLAKEIGVTSQAVKNWEKSRNFPNVMNMQQIEKVFENATILLHFWNTKH